MRKELLKGLTDEQIKKVEACNSSEEVLALAKAEGVALTDEQLEAVSGGGCFQREKCPKCGSRNTGIGEYDKKAGKNYTWCNSCGHEFYFDGTPKTE